MERITDPETGRVRVRVVRPWTDPDMEYLATNYGRTPMRTMQRHLGRTPDAIEKQAKREGLRKGDEDYGYTVTSVALITGRTTETVVRWIETRRLAATRRHTDRPRDLWAVTAKALRSFVMTYPAEVNPGRAAAEGCWHLLVDIIANRGHGAGEFGIPERRETEDEAGADEDMEDEDSR